MNEPAYFPAPLEGETIYSLCARFHKAVGGSAVATARRLRMRGAHATPAVPVNLAFLERITGGLLRASEETLRERSILRAYLPLLPIEQRRIVVLTCQSDSGAGLAQSRAGLSCYTNCAKLLKYCASCAASDAASYSLAIWRTDHQLPGIWICFHHREPLRFVRQHGKRRGWALPSDQDLQAVRVGLESGASLKALAVGRCVTWISKRTTVNLGLLQKLVRSRLKAGGYCRSELKLLTSEKVHLADAAQQYYKEVPVPDIQSVNNRQWLPLILGEKSHYDPLTWALALAWIGDTDPDALTAEYKEMEYRGAQPDLLRSHARVRAAPPDVYAACAGGGMKTEVARLAKLTVSEVDSWLRKDSVLNASWRAAKRQKRMMNALSEIRQFIIQHPTAQRSAIQKNCHASYTWLAVNEPQALHGLIPAPATWVRQIPLFV